MKFLLFLFSLPTAVLALTYNTSSLPYTDVPADRETQVAISTLTELGVVQGNPNGTFAPNVPINRAEFIAIVMRLLPSTNGYIDTACFPDVDPYLWFAESACRAKELDIVRGNAVVGLSPDEYPFEPTRSVKYEEALKILTEVFDIPMNDSTGEWYQQYVDTAVLNQVQLADGAVGSALTRGQMARLTTAYIALSRGELTKLRNAQTSSSRQSSVRTVLSPSSMSSSANSSVSSSYSSSLSTIYDEYLNDNSTDESVLILGQVTSILGSAKLFSNNEPILIKKFIIDLVAPNSSIDAMNVYDETGLFLGRATRSSSTRFELSVSSQNIIAPYRDDYSFYVRGLLRPDDQGGTSGGSVQISQMGIEGVGDWSSRDYEKFTSGETFADSQVARGSIVNVSNAGDDFGVLVPGPGTELASFKFTGATGSSSADVRILEIFFQIEAPNTVTVADAYLRVDGGNDSHSCTVGGNQITCSSLPAEFGDIEDGSRILRVYGDVAISNPSASASLRLSIKEPGSPSSPGSITWTDGVTTFQWVDSAERPIANGTTYRY